MVDDQQADALTSPPAAPESEFAAFCELLAVVGDGTRYAAHVGGLRERIKSAADGEAALAAEQRMVAETAAATRTALNAELETLANREVAAVEKRRALEPRRERIRELHVAWRVFGEPNALQAPQFDALTKALMAHGLIQDPEPSADEHFPAAGQLAGFRRPDHWRPAGLAGGDDGTGAESGEPLDVKLPNHVGSAPQTSLPPRKRRRNRLRDAFLPPGVS